MGKGKVLAKVLKGFLKVAKTAGKKVIENPDKVVSTYVAYQEVKRVRDEARARDEEAGFEEVSVDERLALVEEDLGNIKKSIEDFVGEMDTLLEEADAE